MWHKHKVTRWGFHERVLEWICTRSNLQNFFLAILTHSERDFISFCPFLQGDVTDLDITKAKLRTTNIADYNKQTFHLYDHVREVFLPCIQLTSLAFIDLNFCKVRHFLSAPVNMRIVCEGVFFSSIQDQLQIIYVTYNCDKSKHKWSLLMPTRTELRPDLKWYNFTQLKI